MAASITSSANKRLWLVGLTLVMMSCTDKQRPAPFSPTGSQHQFMTAYLEPAAEHIWDSAGFIITIDGEQDLQPTSDEGWAAVAHHATVVAEGGNLLMLPGYLPEDADPADWMEYSAGLTRAALRARTAAQAQDADALFSAGGEIYVVGRACHNKYLARSDTSFDD